MENLKKIFSKTKIAVLSIFIAVFSFTFLSFDDDDDFELIKNLDIFHSIFRELRTFYVDEVNTGKVIETGIEKMLLTLDPYTNYYPESEIEDYRFMTTGEYGGVGAIIQKVGDKVVIVEIYKDYPAYKAGLKAGDIIVEVQGQPIKGKNDIDINKFLRGQPKSEISLKIQRPGQKELIEKKIIRENISISNVPYFGVLQEGVGYIKLSGFTENAGQEVGEALKKLKSEHHIKSLVFDLRDNPGGLLIEAVNIVNLFVNQGTEVVSTKGKVEQWNKKFTCSYAAVDVEIPIVVLVDRGSASAAEIVSGALQDLDRAVIVGQRTFGKGLVQTTRDLAYGTKLKITTAKYYIPSGRCIQALDYSHRNPDGSVGVVPDSLTTEFKTKNQRKVFDGGGILPDVVLPEANLSKIAQSLLEKNLIFDYATLYAQKYDSIPSAKDFSFNQTDYQHFVSFLQGKDFDYESESDQSLKKLIEVAKKEKYFDQATAEFEKLKTKLSHDKNKDLQLFQDEISFVLTSEIASRYYYQNGRIENSLKNDKEISAAIEILNNKTKYYSILGLSNKK